MSDTLRSEGRVGVPQSTLRRARGFTLVELLVVIGIIAVLISILLPSLAKARQAALAVSCMSQERQFGNALVLYAQDNKGTFPPFSWSSGPFASVPIWPALYAPVLSSQWSWPFERIISGASNPASLYRCPASSLDGDQMHWWGMDVNITYGINAFLNSNYAGGTTDYRLEKLAQVKNSSECAYMMDMELGSNNNNIFPMFYGWDGDPERYAYIHNGKRNVLYCDGHVETISQQQWPNEPVLQTDPAAEAPFLSGDHTKYDPNAPAAVLKFFLGK